MNIDLLKIMIREYKLVHTTRSELEQLTDDQIIDMIGEDAYQRACSVAIDSYDKTGTFYDEVMKTIKSMVSQIVKEENDSRSKK